MAKNSGSKITKFDAAEYLDTPELVAAYLSEAFESKDKAFISDAFSTVMRSKGMTEVARKAKVSRESLYRSFDGKTDAGFGTVQKVLEALGLELAVKPRSHAKAA